MTPESIARALNGRKSGNTWMARCPAHEDSTPSLAISSAAGGTILVHCHAGCPQLDVITALRERGLWAGGDGRRSDRPMLNTAAIASDRQENRRRTETALNLWRGTMSAVGTRGETYLRSRGITLSPPDRVRFHETLKHPAGGRWPGLVALVTRGSDDEPLAIHRTFLRPDGSGKAAVTPDRMMLGPCRTGAVRLSAAGETLLVGEGLETCLSAMQATGLPAWSALSTSGLTSLVLPDAVRTVIILADGDPAGERAALLAADRWTREGRAVRIARPPQGMDFNDVLMQGPGGRNV